jgi:uncharacterized coiled-coil protein SlyX
MEEDREMFRDGERGNGYPRWSGWVDGLVAFLLLAIGLGAGYAYCEHSAAKEIAAHDADVNATVTKLRNQLDTVTTKLNDMATAQAAPAQPGLQPERPAANTANRRTASASDKRYKQLQARLDAQQKELKDTEDSVAQTRSDLEGSISSTKDELNGTIAKNHDELVALERRGERDYFEFDLWKGKQFQRTGPISLSLRHADGKHLNYDVVALVDDNQLSKKHVDLYEPIWFDRADDPQPLQVVVNKVEKNHIHGYVNAPKYRNSELAANGAPGVKPVSATSSTTNGASAPGSDEAAAAPQNQNAPSQPQ